MSRLTKSKVLFAGLIVVKGFEKAYKGPNHTLLFATRWAHVSTRGPVTEEGTISRLTFPYLESV